jgi:hypothetical protein
MPVREFRQDGSRRFQLRRVSDTFQPVQGTLPNGFRKRFVARKWNLRIVYPRQTPTGQRIVAESGSSSAV